MLELLPSYDAFPVAKKHAWLCLLLAVSFVYNPFLSAPVFSPGLSVRHPASYRATVASAELLKFKNPEGRHLITIADCDLSEAFALLQRQARPSTQYDNTEHPLPPQQFLSGNVWFRPPPAA